MCASSYFWMLLLNLEIGGVEFHICYPLSIFLFCIVENGKFSSWKYGLAQMCCLSAISFSSVLLVDSHLWQFAIALGRALRLFLIKF